MNPVERGPIDVPRLDLREIGLRFGAVQALDGVSLQVRAGEIIALLGDSGCGKSTLLRVVAGLERPQAGEVRLDGGVVASARFDTPPEARGVGLMFQDYALFPHLTVGENVRFGLHGRPGAQARAAARARLEQVGLLDREASYPGTLSGGESQRVALARALAPGPRVLLLDEPFSNLDQRTRDRVRADTLSVLRGAGATALVVTHDPEEAMMLADRIGLMRAGRLVQTGSGEDLYRRPVSHFAARFFGTLVEFVGPCRAGRVATPLGALPTPGFAEGTSVRVCLRPEALRFVGEGEGLKGRIVGRTFLGATARLEIAADGLDVPLRLAVPCADTLGLGETVFLGAPDDGILAFAASQM